MSDFKGEDLMRVFNELHVQLFNVHSNVIKGWFDTDDKDMKNLLNWMCYSLSSENYSSPLENAEYNKINAPLSDQKRKEMMINIEEKYPGIFDVDANSADIELYEDEINLLLAEEEDLYDLLRMTEELQSKLSKEVNEKSYLEIKTTSKLKSTQEQCYLLGEQLDGINKKLYEQLGKYGEILYNFEFDSSLNFINNMDVQECHKKFNTIKSFLTPALEELPLPSTSITDPSNSEISTIADSTVDSLCTMRYRILHSYQKYLVSNIEMEKVQAVLNYLNKSDTDSMLILTDSSYLRYNIENKEDIKKNMCGMLDNISTKFADHQIALAKIKHAQQGLENFQSKLDNLSKIEHFMKKLLSQYCLLSVLFVQEKTDIENSGSFLRKIYHYISRDLQNSRYRIDKMKNVIEDFNSKSVDEKFKFIKSITKIIVGEDTFTLNRAVEVISDFKNELNILENALFNSNFANHRSIAAELRHNVNILQSFLICGPTHRVVVIPSELQLALREVDENLRKQLESVRSAVEISAPMKKVTSKWQNYRRQLWMYFYAQPHRLDFIMHQIQEEFKNLKVNQP